MVTPLSYKKYPGFEKKSIRKKKNCVKLKLILQRDEGGGGYRTASVFALCANFGFKLEGQFKVQTTLHMNSMSTRECRVTLK